MTDREIEQAILAAANEEKPDLWSRIEAGLPEEKDEKVIDMTEIKAQKENKDTKTKKRGFKRFIGSSIGLAACVCGIMILGSAFTNVGGYMNSAAKYAASSTTASSTAGRYYGSEGAGAGAVSGSVNDFSEGAYVEEAAEAAYAYDAGEVFDSKAETTAASADTTVADELTDNKRKLIRNVNLSIETKAFDDMLANIEAQTNAAGGYVETSSVSGNSYYSYNRRSAYYVCRIPSGKTDAFLESMGQGGVITSTSESVEDVSLSYIDTESRISSLRTEQERLLALLDQAETVEDIMSIESRLTDVRYQLESYESQLRNLDNRINYDTVYLNVTEVKEVELTEEASFIERISRGFSDSLGGVAEGLSDFVLMLIVNIPYYVVFIIIFAIIIKIIKVIIKKIRKK